MHHPEQYRQAAEVYQQEQLRQAAVRRAAKEAGVQPFGWLRWPWQLLKAILRYRPSTARRENEYEVSPKPRLQE